MRKPKPIPAWKFLVLVYLFLLFAGIALGAVAYLNYSDCDCLECQQSECPEFEARAQAKKHEVIADRLYPVEIELPPEE